MKPGELRKVVDEDSIILRTLGGDLLLVLDVNEFNGMIEVLMQNGVITKFSESWMHCHTVVLSG